jgi:predicted dehydrogenase
MRCIASHFTIKDNKIMLNVAVIGLSKQGLMHVEAIRRHAEYNLIGICDKDIDVLARTAVKFNCTAFASADSLMEKTRLDALVLCLPHDQYEEVIDMAFAQGLHVLKEKPLARNLDEAGKLIRKAKTHKVKLGIAAQRRFHPTYKLAKKQLSLIGKPYCVRITHCDNKRNDGRSWRHSKDLAGGGVLLDLGYHLLDIASWYFGKPQQIYKSLTQTEFGSINMIENVEETASVSMELPEGSICQVFISRQSSPKTEEIIIHGLDGHLKVTRSRLQRFSRSGDEIEVKEYDYEWTIAMKSQLDDFISLLHGEHALTSSESHLNTLQLVQAIYDSLN